VGASVVVGVCVFIFVNFGFVNNRIMDEVYDVIVLGTGLKVNVVRVADYMRTLNSCMKSPAGVRWR